MISLICFVLILHFLKPDVTALLVDPCGRRKEEGRGGGGSWSFFCPHSKTGSNLAVTPDGKKELGKPFFTEKFNNYSKFVIRKMLHHLFYYFNK
jgi:hypothetical protein